MENNKRVLVSLFIFWLILLSIFSQKILAQTSNLRIPILFTYGHTDGNEQRLFIDTGAFQIANVIEGYTAKGSDYFKEKGLLFTYHAYGLPSLAGGSGCQTTETCSQFLVNNWKAKFEAGFQAIAIDEFCSSNVLFNNSQTDALNKIRQLYPISASNHKYIFAWGSSKCYTQIGKGVGIESLLSTIKTKADYFMPEIYFYEGNFTFSNFNTYLSQIESAAPGILDKSLVGIAMADTENYTPDLQPNIEFKEYLDEQFHFLANGQFASRIKGIAAYSYARSRPDTIVWLQNLFNHYFLLRKKTYFNPDGYNLTTINNGSFEQGTANWQFSPTSGSSATVITYDSLNSSGIRIVGPGLMVRVPHPNQRNCNVQSNSHCLFLKKGSGQGSNISQVVNVQSNTNYVVDIYVINGTHLDQEAAFDVSLSGTSGLVSSIYKEKTLLPSNTSSCQTADRWTKMKVFFTTGNESSITFTISDKQAPANNKVVIDFVQMEKAKGQVPSTPSPTTQPSPTSPPPTPTPTPTGQPSNILGDVNHDGHVDMADYSLFVPKYGTNDSNCDFNKNGVVDLGDYSLLVSNYGRQTES